MVHKGWRLPLPHSQCNILAGVDASTAVSIQTCDSAAVRRRIACPTHQPVLSPCNSSVFLVAHILLKPIHSSFMAPSYLSVPASNTRIRPLRGQYIRHSHPFHPPYLGHHSLASLRPHPLRLSIRRRRILVSISLTSIPSSMGPYFWVHEPHWGSYPTRLSLFATMV